MNDALSVVVDREDTDMKTQKNGRRRGRPGNGVGSHHETSPMGHATRTKSKTEKHRSADRRAKQRGWT